MTPTFPPALAHPPLNFSTGQILSFIMILAGLLWAFVASRMTERVPVRIYPDNFSPIAHKQEVSPEEKSKERNKRRTMRKKLK